MTDSVPSMIDASRLHMQMAVILSLAVHAAVGWMVHDKSLIGDRPSNDDQDERLLRVRRADFELPVDTMAPNPALESEVAEVDLQQLSEVILAGAAALEPAPPPNAQPNITEVSETRDQDTPWRPQSMPLPDTAAQMLEELAGHLPLEVPYVEGPGDVQVALPSDRGASGSAVARQLLAEVGLAAAPGPRIRDLPAPPLYEPSPTEQRRVVSNAPPIPVDFRVLLKRSSSRLKPPKYLDDDFTYELYVYQPADHLPQQKGGYLRLDITGRRSLRKLRTMPKDVIFLIDTSGSISQVWVKAVNRGIIEATNYLNQNQDPTKRDRFNIVMFKDSAAFLSPESILPVNARTLDRARKFLGGAKAGGYTDVNRALSRLLLRDVDVERVYDLILISDGRPTRGVRDTRELINLITRDNDLAASIYCVGIGNRQNRPLLEYLAYRNRGFCVFADTSQNVSVVIRDLASRLRYPIIKDVELHVASLGADSVFPRHIPNIHQGETFSIFGQFTHFDVFNLQVSGMNQSRNVAFTFSRNLETARPGDKSVAQGWAFWKIHDLYSEQIRRGKSKHIEAQIEWLKRNFEIEMIE